jgi:hypothetical protein
LPSVTLGKAFAECKIAFAVCLRHTAKELIPVVLVEVYRYILKRIMLNYFLKTHSFTLELYFL